MIASFHWGSAWKRGFLTDYEREVAPVAIDAGADLVLGHHHHFLRGVEFHEDRPIFYGLGHFVFDLTWIGAKLPQPEIERLKEAYGDYAIYPREGLSHASVPPGRPADHGRGRADRDAKDRRGRVHSLRDRSWRTRRIR